MRIPPQDRANKIGKTSDFGLFSVPDDLAKPAVPKNCPEEAR
jgi:hypothetical protein